MEAAYETDRRRLFHADDSHWNEQGVDLAADILSRRLRGCLTPKQRNNPRPV
jgi:hypothetical protein